MIKVQIIRFSSSDQGTLGYFISEGFQARIIELPWKDNATNISCIPAGKYQCVYRYSKKFREHYYVMNINGRTYVLIHSGNFAGDTSKGYKTHSHGCLIIGKYHGKIDGQDAVLLSRPTLRGLVKHMNMQLFEVEIIDSYKMAA